MHPERQKILEEVRRVRDGVQTHRNPNFAQHVVRIPMADFQALCMLYPGLKAHDPAEHSAAWEAFYKSPFSEAYHINRTHRGIIKNGNLIK